MIRLVMFTFLRKMLTNPHSSDKNKVDEGVSFSVKKYSQTYKLLENYDQTATRTPKMVSERRNVQAYIRRLQGAN